MKPERFVNHVKDVALTLGEWALYQLRDLETPPIQAASITHYGTKEESWCLSNTLEPSVPLLRQQPAIYDHSNQLPFHQQQLLQGLPEAMQAHHLDMINRLGRAA